MFTFKQSIDKLNIYKRWLINNIESIDFERFIIMSSAILFMYGIRNLDVLVYGNNNIKSINFLDKIKMATLKFANILHDMAVTNTELCRSIFDTKDNIWFPQIGVKHCDELIFNPSHFIYFSGIKIVSLNNIIIHRKLRHNVKDIVDIHIICKIFKIKCAKCIELKLNRKDISHAIKHLS